MSSLTLSVTAFSELIGLDCLYLIFTVVTWGYFALSWKTENNLGIKEETSQKKTVPPFPHFFWLPLFRGSRDRQ